MITFHKKKKKIREKKFSRKYTLANTHYCYISRDQISAKIPQIRENHKSFFP